MAPLHQACQTVTKLNLLIGSQASIKAFMPDPTQFNLVETNKSLMASLKMHSAMLPQLPQS